MAKTVSAAAAKTHFADALRDAESGETVVITRYGKPVAVLVHPALVSELERLKAAGSGGGLAGLVGRYADGNELADALDEQAERGDGRPLPELG